MKLIIKYSIEFETQRIFNAIKKIDWYNKMGYNLYLPAKIKLMNLEKIAKLSKQNIKEIIAKEYNIKDYQKIKSIIIKKWKNISSKFYQNLLAIKLKPELSYDLILTKYGVGGSYNLPNKIILNVSKKTDEDLVRIIIHEIIHLIIEPLIQKYKIEHWSKERIVDLMLFKMMPETAKMQKLPQDIEKIDKIFNKYFPDVIKIIKKI